MTALTQFGWIDSVSSIFRQSYANSPRQSSVFSIEPLEPRRFLTAAVVEGSLASVSSGALRQDLQINDAWKFFKGSVEGAQWPSFNDSTWKKVNLPHTWNTYDGQDGGNNYYRGTGWYRRHLQLGAYDSSQRHILRFEGAALCADVYLNGATVGSHRGGYSAFAFDITPLLKFNADNVLAIKVNNANRADVAPVIPPLPLKQDFTVFGGLYRDVHLLVTNQLSITPLDRASDGVFVTPSRVSSASADLRVVTRVRNESAVTRKATVTARLLDASGAAVRTLSRTISVPAKSTWDVSQTTTLARPHLWNGRKDPYVYQVEVRLSDGGKAVDSVTVPCGIRSIKLDADKGFLLNGKPYDLRGVNFHQDRQDKGYAVSDSDLAQDVSLIMDIGATAVRLAHYQHAETTYDLLDQAGLVTWSEVPVYASVGTVPEFRENAKEQLRELILQNYNHPSICFWGLQNEVPDSAVAMRIVEEMNQQAHLKDPTRIAVAATNIEGTPAIDAIPDALAFNKYFGWYSGVFSDLGPWLDEKRELYPDRPLGMSEYGAGAALTQHSETPSRPVPWGAFHPEEWSNLLHEATWPQLKARSWLWCKLVWQMFDSASDSRACGDTPGRNDKGLVSYDRNMKKDAYYFYKANWSDQSVLHLTGQRFSHRTAATTEVKVYSNCEKVSLILNGKHIMTVYRSSTSNGIFKWTDLTLASGTNIIKVSGIRGGKTYIEQCTWTLDSGDSHRVQAASMFTGWNEKVWLQQGLDQLHWGDAFGERV